MEGGSKTTPGFNGTGDDMSAPGGWVAFVFVQFAKRSGNAWLLVRSACVSGHRVPYGSVKNVFGG